MGRRLAGFALAALFAHGLLAVPAASAVAAADTAPHEVAVFPESEATTPAYEAVFLAGKSGFLHRHGSSADYLWTRYDTGKTVVVKDMAGVFWGSFRSAGGDSVSFADQVPTKPAPGKVSVLDLSDQSWQQWTLPTGYGLSGVYGQSMLLNSTPDATTMTLELRTFAADGTWTTTPVTGLPAGASRTPNAAVIGDSTSVVVPYYSGGYRYGLLDLATGKLVTIPGAERWPSLWRISGNTVAWGAGTTYHLYSRSGLTNGTDSAARLITLPSDSMVITAIVGDGLVTSRIPPYGSSSPLVYASADGSAGTELLPRLDTRDSIFVQGPDGTALAVGGTGAKDWAVHRISAQPGQAPTATPLLPVRDPVNNAGLVYHQGLVRHVQTQVEPVTGKTQYAVFNHPVVPDATITTGGGLLDSAATCAPQAQCVRLVEGNDLGAAYLRPEADGSDAIVTLTNVRPSPPRRSPTRNGRIVDVGDNYVLVNDGTTANQYVIDVNRLVTVRTAPVTGAALWFNTLWTATSTAGQLQAIDLDTGKTTRTVATGAACVPTEVRTSTRWLWWACGSTGPAGVYDLRGNRNLPVPAGPVLLGDGFLVRHNTTTASLQMTAFQNGTLEAPVKLANLPPSTFADDRGITWAVDRHGSGVAYVDPDNAVHAIDTGVPGTAPELGSYSANGTVRPGSPSQQLDAYLRVSRPLTGWELTITRKWTGEIVHRQTGGAARQALSATWDGNLGSGNPALNGPYRWTLTGSPGEGAAQATVGSGQFSVVCGTFPFRSYDCHGGSGLLGVKPNGEAHWYGTRQDGNVPGRLYDNGATEWWCLSGCVGSARTSALVPFGDFDGDRLPDLLVRDGSGYMRAYLGVGELRFNTGKTKSLGAGWMMYKSILAPGDVNRDGHDDILGIDTYGKLWLYITTGKGGINPRVQVGSGWNIYKRVIGAGDLNGDGHGDLIGIDSTGVMYRYFSNGNKGWSSRAKVFSGWNIYNSVVAIGDLNEDGRNDLVARDANGVLWSYAGLGNGSFAPRAKAGTGWNMYKILI